MTGTSLNNVQEIATQATASNTGAGLFTFRPVTQGQWWWVSCVVPTAANTAAFILYVTGQEKFGWLGPQPSASIVLTRGQTVTVKATGLVAMQAVVALLIGGWEMGTARGIPPQGPSSYNQSSVTNITNYLPASASEILTVRRELLGASPVQADATFPFKIGLVVSALTSNKGLVFVGGSAVSVDSYALSPGQGIAFAVANANVIWVLGTTGDYANFLGE
jgi:hypothetical protein